VSQNDFVDEDDFLKAALDNKLPMIKSYLARGADPDACDNVSLPNTIKYKSTVSIKGLKHNTVFFPSSTVQLYTELVHKETWRL